MTTSRPVYPVAPYTAIGPRCRERSGIAAKIQSCHEAPRDHDRGVVTAFEGDEVLQVARLMRDRGVGSVVICDPQGDPPR